MTGRWAAIFALLVALLLPLASLASEGAKPSSPRTLSFGAFGVVTLYRERPHPSRVVLFASGDGGWNLGVVDMARALAARGALVAGFSTPRYLHKLQAAGRRCAYPAADLQALGQFVERALAYPAYVEPMLVGYSSGATLAYAAAVQAPTGTFRGAISLGFCPELEVQRPFCRGAGLASQRITHPEKGYRFAPAPSLQVPWIVLQGEADAVCAAATARDFVAQVPHGAVVMLPKVGHGYGVERHWMPQFLAAYERMAAAPAPPPPAGAPPSGASAPDVSDLPLVEVPAGTGSSDLLAIVLSGDGGWASLDRQVAGALAERGVTAVGLDSLRYLWTRRTPNEAGVALTRIARHYLAVTGRRRLVLVGYSLGADILPFMADRLPPDLKARTALVALLAPGVHAEFEFHLSNWLGSAPKTDRFPIAPEVARLAPLRVLCVYGATEKESLCPTLPAGQAIIDVRPDGHHLGGDYVALAKRILAEAKAGVRRETRAQPASR